MGLVTSLRSVRDDSGASVSSMSSSIFASASAASRTNLLAAGMNSSLNHFVNEAKRLIDPHFLEKHQSPARWFVGAPGIGEWCGVIFGRCGRVLGVLRPDMRNVCVVASSALLGGV